MARPKRSNPFSTGIGAVTGAILGAVGGAAAGAVLGFESMPLEEALRRYFAERGVALVSVRSATRGEISVTFRAHDGVYYVLTASTELDSPRAEDDLYDHAVTKFDSWQQQHA